MNDTKLPEENVTADRGVEKPTTLDYILAFAPIPAVAEQKTKKLLKYWESADEREYTLADKELTHIACGAIRYVILPLTVIHIIKKFY